MLELLTSVLWGVPCFFKGKIPVLYKYESSWFLDGVHIPVQLIEGHCRNQGFAAAVV